MKWKRGISLLLVLTLLAAILTACGTGAASTASGVASAASEAEKSAAPEDAGTECAGNGRCICQRNGVRSTGGAGASG